MPPLEVAYYHSDSLFFTGENINTPNILKGKTCLPPKYRPGVCRVVRIILWLHRAEIENSGINTIDMIDNDRKESIASVKYKDNR